MRKFVIKLSLMLGMVMAGAAAQADWPEKPIRFIVPAPPGSDVLIRIVSDDVAKRLGQPIVVENRDGASGNIGTQAAAAAAPDGYTFLLAHSPAMVINRNLFRSSLKIDPVKAFAPVMHMADFPGVLFSSATVPAKDFRSFVAYARANRGKLNYGSPGLGSTPSIALERVSRALALELNHVPYRGSPLMLPALIAGDIHVGFGMIGPFLPQVQQGKLHILAVSGDKRLPFVPDTPTFRELGLPNIGGETWWAVMAPTGTPEPILERMNAALRQSLATPDVRKRIEDAGFVVVGSSREQMAEKMAREASQWTRTLRELNIQPID